MTYTVGQRLSELEQSLPEVEPLDLDALLVKLGYARTIEEYIMTYFKDGWPPVWLRSDFQWISPYVAAGILQRLRNKMMEDGLL